MRAGGLMVITYLDRHGTEERNKRMDMQRERLYRAEAVFVELTGRDLMVQDSSSERFVMYDGETVTGIGNAAVAAERAVRFVWNQVGRWLT